MCNLDSKFEVLVFIVVCHFDVYNVMHKCCCGCVDDLRCCIVMFFFCDEEFRLVVKFFIWGYCLCSDLTERVKLDNDDMLMASTIYPSYFPTNLHYPDPLSLHDRQMELYDNIIYPSYVSLNVVLMK